MLYFLEYYIMHKLQNYKNLQNYSSMNLFISRNLWKQYLNVLTCLITMADIIVVNRIILYVQNDLTICCQKHKWFILYEIVGEKMCEAI